MPQTFLYPRYLVSNFAKYFKAVNNPDSAFFCPDEDTSFIYERYIKNEIQIMFSELDEPISNIEISKAIAQLKNGKCGGPDKLINEFFSSGANVLTPYICKIFNVLFEIGHFPRSWSLGEIIPLHKKGKLDNVDNYRGITLLSTLGKLFSRVLNNRLSEWAEHYNVYIEAQTGFRPGMSTTDNIFILHSIITHLLNHGKKLYAAFVDFSKAFDYVVRDVLWYKLINIGVRGKILTVIMSMYENAKSRVKYNGKVSEEFTCATGVRQGDCLSPLLFAIYVNDIETEFFMKGADGIDIGMLKLFVLLYADDIVIFSETEVGLQKGLHILYGYCQKWKLVVNIQKTKIIVFRKGGFLRRNLTFKYGDIALEIDNKFVYLGIIFTVGASFSLAESTLAGQAQKAIFQLYRYLYKFTDVHVSHVLELFDKLIRPILEYGAEVWGLSQAKCIERVHLQFCKKLLGVKQSTQNDFIYGETGRTTLAVNRYVKVLKYWIKICHSNNQKYIKVVYEMLLDDINVIPRKQNWASLVKHLLSSLGFMYAWSAQSIGDTDVFLSLVRQRLTDQFIQNWRSRLEESSRATLYRYFDSFEFKPYLDSVNVEKFRIGISRLRTSSHRLEIEAGRWTKPRKTPIEQRLCYSCHVLEDEYHFILECPVYHHLRCMYISKYYWSRPNMYKFLGLITSENVEIMRKLGNYIFKAFRLRTDNIQIQ